MFYNINPISNSAYYSSDALSTTQRLQGLGITPSGNVTKDKTTLQDYQKLTDALEINNLSVSISNDSDFNTLLAKLQSGQLTTENTDTKSKVETSEVKDNNEEQKGATQVGELNKAQLGIAA